MQSGEGRKEEARKKAEFQSQHKELAKWETLKKRKKHTWPSREF